MKPIAMKTYGPLLLTRERGREVAEALPRQTKLVLDFEGIDAASPSFLHELLMGLVAKGTRAVDFQNVTHSVAENLSRLARIEEPDHLLVHVT